MTTTLSISSLSRRQGDAGCERPILAPLTRSFEPGKLSVVTGPSGAGKTTLLSLLSLAVPASSGTILHGATDLGELDPVAAQRWRRTRLGMVFQTSRLIKMLSVAEHIELAAMLRPAGDAHQRGLDLLDRLGLGDKLAARPSELSAGEKRRVALAQAMCIEPEIILADEPTAALDSVDAQLVGSCLRDYAHRSNAVVICVSQDRQIIDNADDLLTLEKS